MSLVCTPGLRKLLTDADLLLDTCTIIDASKCSAVDNFLHEVRDSGCTLLSIPPVRDEFTCSACSAKEYKELSDFMASLQILFLDKFDGNALNHERAEFNVALRRCKGINPSYVDRALLFALYFYRNSSAKLYLMTSNYKDVPEDLFERVGFIAHDFGGFHNIGVYALKLANLQKKMAAA